jgi:hypothetical protein
MKKNMCVFNLILFVFISCKEKHNITSIDKQVLDVTEIKGDFILKNQNNEIDTLKLIDFSENIVDERVISPMRDDEVGHFITYDYSFKEDTFSLGLRKSDIEYEFSIHSSDCFFNDIHVPFSQIKNDTIIDFKFKNCKSNIQKIILNKFIVHQIYSNDGNIWKLIKFVPITRSVP